MRIIIAGSREFNNYELLRKECDILMNGVNNIRILSGTANGADKLGERYAYCYNYELIKYPAEWDKYGKSAGYKRNEEMAKNADVLIVFWDGKSKGTKHMIDIAKRFNLDIKIVYYNN